MLRAVLVVMAMGLGCDRPSTEGSSAPAASTSVARPSSSSSAPAASSTPPASSSSSAPPAAASSAPPPAVDVRSIGMHIGGGPNDDANKAPLLASIAPHHEALGRCWAALPNQPKVEFGIDAHVPAKGGRAKIERPRSTVNDATFIACAVAVFVDIEFLPPKSRIDTTVSTSVRMAPRR